MEPHDKDEFNDLLAGSLKRYGEVEPRAGLEGRVLARLAEETHTNSHWAWMWVPATTCACLLAVVVWIGIVGKRERPHIGREATKVLTKGNRLETAEVRSQMDKPRRLRTHEVRKTPLQVANTTPRLEHFPSPRPLSEQEKLLVAYVREYPKQAAEVAQEQSEREQEFQAMYPVPGPDSNQER